MAEWKQGWDVFCCVISIAHEKSLGVCDIPVLAGEVTISMQKGQEGVKE